MALGDCGARVVLHRQRVLELLLQVLRDGLSMRAGWVSLRQGEAWAPALSTGLMDPPTQALTELAAEQVRQRTVAYLETDDPSPARTVADEFGISPANARKIHERHFTRVNAVIWADERYEPLRHWDWFAA